MTRNPCCEDCDFMSYEERYGDGGHWWTRHCGLADGAQIEMEEGEPCPQWCPLLEAKP